MFFLWNVSQYRNSFVLLAWQQKRKKKNGLYPLKFLILGFHPNITLLFLCLIFLYNVFSKLKSISTELLLFSGQCIIWPCYIHVSYNVHLFYTAAPSRIRQRYVNGKDTDCTPLLNVFDKCNAMERGGEDSLDAMVRTMIRHCFIINGFYIHLTILSSFLSSNKRNSAHWDCLSLTFEWFL